MMNTGLGGRKNWGVRSTMEQKDDEKREDQPRILAVDDDRGVQFTLRQLLKKHGYAGTVCQNGVEALEWLRRETFALMMTDLEMPGMGGLELIKAARELHPDLPVLVMTADVSTE